MHQTMTVHFTTFTNLLIVKLVVGYSGIPIRPPQGMEKAREDQTEFDHMNPTYNN